MGSLLVVMVDVDAEDVLELAAAEDQQPVEAFAAYGADPALHVRVRVRRLDGRTDDLGSIARKESVECPRELRVAIMDQERTGRVTVVESDQEVAPWCSIHAVSGLPVQAKYSIRRFPIEMKAST